MTYNAALQNIVMMQSIQNAARATHEFYDGIEKDEQENEHRYRMRAGFTQEMNTALEAASLSDMRKAAIVSQTSDINADATFLQAKSDYNAAQRKGGGQHRDGTDISVSIGTHVSSFLWGTATVAAGGAVGYLLTEGGKSMPKDLGEWLLAGSFSLLVSVGTYVIGRVGRDSVNASRQQKLDKKLEEKTKGLATLYEEAVNAISDPEIKQARVLADPRVKSFVAANTTYTFD